MITVLNSLLPFSTDYSVSHNSQPLSLQIGITSVELEREQVEYCAVLKYGISRVEGDCKCFWWRIHLNRVFVMHQEHLGTHMRKKVSLARCSSGFCYLNSGVTLLVMVFPVIFLAANKEENRIKLFVMYPPIK